MPGWPIAMSPDTYAALEAVTFEPAACAIDQGSWQWQACAAPTCSVPILAAKAGDCAILLHFHTKSAAYRVDSNWTESNDGGCCGPTFSTTTPAPTVPDAAAK